MDNKEIVSEQRSAPGVKKEIFLFSMEEVKTNILKSLDVDCLRWCSDRDYNHCMIISADLKLIADESQVVPFLEAKHREAITELKAIYRYHNVVTFNREQLSQQIATEWYPLYEELSIKWGPLPSELNQNLNKHKANLDSEIKRYWQAYYWYELASWIESKIKNYQFPHASAVDNRERSVSQWELTADFLKLFDSEVMARTCLTVMNDLSLINADGIHNIGDRDKFQLLAFVEALQQKNILPTARPAPKLTSIIAKQIQLPYDRPRHGNAKQYDIYLAEYISHLNKPSVMASFGR